jgi:hypothetical protein
MATDPDLGDKAIHTTFARTLGPLSKMADFLGNVLVYYRWRRVVTVTMTRFIWTDAARAMKQVGSWHP